MCVDSGSAIAEKAKSESKYIDNGSNSALST